MMAGLLKSDEQTAAEEAGDMDKAASLGTVLIYTHIHTYTLDCLFICFLDVIHIVIIIIISRVLSFIYLPFNRSYRRSTNQCFLQTTKDFS